METIKLKKMDRQEIINTLMSGGILAFPTDTVFGLACIIDKDAIQKVYEAKGRDFDKPLPMMCCDLKMIEEVAYVSDSAKKLIERFVPGPLTMIFKKKEVMNFYLIHG